MKNTLIRLVLASGIVVSVEAGDTPNVEGTAVKPASSVAVAANAESQWGTSFEAAKKVSAERGIPILADFSGSDWCGWCIKLEKEVFSKAAFKDYAKTNVVLLLVDFPRRKTLGTELKSQNQKLAQTYGIEGFPTVLLLDSTGKELARTGYQPGGAEKYVEHLKSLLKK